MTEKQVVTARLSGDRAAVLAAHAQYEVKQRGSPACRIFSLGLLADLSLEGAMPDIHADYARADDCIRQLLTLSPELESGRILQGRSLYAAGDAAGAFKLLTSIECIAKPPTADMRGDPMELLSILKGLGTAAAAAMQTRDWDAASPLLSAAIALASRSGFELAACKRTAMSSGTAAPWQLIIAVLELHFLQARLGSLRSPRAGDWIDGYRAVLALHAVSPPRLHARFCYLYGESLFRAPPAIEFTALHARTSAEHAAPESFAEEAALAMLTGLRAAAAAQACGQVGFSEVARCPLVASTDAAQLCMAAGCAAGTGLTEVLELGVALNPSSKDALSRLAYALMAAHDYPRAALAYESLLSLVPEDARGHVLLARLYLNHFDEAKRAIHHARRALHLKSSAVRAQAIYVLGVACGKVARAVHVDEERVRYQQQALDALETAARLEPESPRIQYNLALQYAECRCIKKALAALAVALELDPSASTAWHLMAVLFSAAKDYNAAMAAVQAGMEEGPDNLQLLITKCALTEEVFGPKKALAAFEAVGQLWRRLALATVGEAAADASITARTPSVSGAADEAMMTRSPSLRSIQAPIAHSLERDIVSKRARLSPLEMSLLARNQSVDFAASIGSTGSVPSPGSSESDASTSAAATPPVAAAPATPIRGRGGSGSAPAAAAATAGTDTVAALAGAFGRQSMGTPVRSAAQVLLREQQIFIWCRVSALYRHLEQYDAARACLVEAAAIEPYSAAILYQSGRIFAARGEAREAAAEFQRVLSLESDHRSALLHLASALLSLGSVDQAEGHLATLMRLDPLRHDTWACLGVIRKAQGDGEAAANCFATALELELSRPLIEFSWFPKVA